MVVEFGYDIIPKHQAARVKELCDELMLYQKSKAVVHPEWFDNMSYETRLVPSLEGARNNLIIGAKSSDEYVGYAYSNIAKKTTYSGGFATLAPVNFFDLESVKGEYVGCLSQFYIKEDYRGKGIGTILFNKSMDWLKSIPDINDLFIFVSNGNDTALNFYLGKGFTVSHQILNGFITVLRSTV